MWSLFLALHLAGLVGYSLLLRKYLTEDMDRWTLATIMQTAVTIPIIPIVLFAFPDLSVYSTGNMSLIAVAALLAIGLHWTTVKALQYLEASVFSILYNMRILLTTILGIFFLGEPVIPLQIAGGLLIFVAVITVRQKGSRKLWSRGVIWGVAAAVSISSLNFFEKNLISSLGFAEYIVPVMLLATALMWSAQLMRKQQRVQLSVFKEPRMLLLMVFRAVSAYGFVLAFSVGGVLSVSSYVSSLSVVVIVVLGMLLLGEKDYMRQKIIATVLAASGLTAILIARLN